MIEEPRADGRSFSSQAIRSRSFPIAEALPVPAPESVTLNLPSFSRSAAIAEAPKVMAAPSVRRTCAFLRSHLNGPPIII